jgi:hypothetical protein
MDCCHGNSGLQVSLGRMPCIELVPVTVRLKEFPTWTETTRSYNHRVVIYGDTSTHPLLVRHIMVDCPGINVKAELEFQVYPNPPKLLMVQVFSEVERRDTDGRTALELVASGSTARAEFKPESCEVQLFDSSQNLMGTLLIAGIPWKLDEIVGQPSDACQDLIDHIFECYKQLPDEDRIRRDIFASLSVHLDTSIKVPTVWFTLHAMQLKFERSVATAYFDRAITIAESMLYSTQRSEFQLLADVLALPSLGWVYRIDKDSRNQPRDTWSSLWNYPPSKVPLSFDCEDGAKALIELTITLQRLADADDDGKLDDKDEPTSKVQRLARLASNYIPWLTIGQLRNMEVTSAHDSTSEFLSHTYVVLEPRDARLPYLTLESTAWASGAWMPVTDPMVVARDKEIYTRMASVNDKLASSGHKCGRVRFPISLVRAERMYGPIIAMISSRVPNPRLTMSTQHKLMRLVEANDLFDRNASKQPKRSFMAINELNTTLTQKMRRELSLAPTSLFPVASAETLPSIQDLDMDEAIVLPISYHQKHVTLQLTDSIQLALVYEKRKNLVSLTHTIKNVARR